MRIFELFDRKLAMPLQWEEGPSVTYAYGQVRTDKGDVSIDITFADEDDGLINIEFMVGGQFNLTGKGGASQVFATVIEGVKKFLTKHTDIHTLTFTAHEPSRAKMYDTLTKRVAKEMGWHVVPYDEVMSDPKYKGLHDGSFLFVIEKGQAPANRQDAQKPQHGGFVPYFYVYAHENPGLPAIKIKANKSMDAENWVIRNVPGYEKEHPMSVFAIKTPPKDREIVDKGEVPPPKPKAPERVLNPLEKALRDKLGN